MDGHELEARVLKLQQLIRGAEGLSEPTRNEMLELVSDVSTLDPLTMLFNRYALANKLEEEISRAVRHDRPLSVIMADADDFKKYNDLYGHLQGDEALKYVARLLSTNRRPEDIVARYGGEEFTLILPETELEGATRVAADIIHRFGTNRLTKFADGSGPSDSKYAEGKGIDLITLSLGISVYPATTKNPLLLLSDADRALYDAKAGGKNRFSIYNPQTRSDLLLPPA